LLLLQRRVHFTRPTTLWSTVGGLLGRSSPNLAHLHSRYTHTDTTPSSAADHLHLHPSHHSHRVARWSYIYSFIQGIHPIRVYIICDYISTHTIPAESQITRRSVIITARRRSFRSRPGRVLRTHILCVTCIMVVLVYRVWPGVYRGVYLYSSGSRLPSMEKRRNIE